GQAQVKQRVRVAEAGRLHGAGEDDDLVLDVGQRRGGDGHGVGAMGDEDVIVGAGGNTGVNQFAVGVIQLETILPNQRLNGIIKPDPRLLQQFTGHRLADLELAERVEIQLVEGAAGAEDLYEHDFLPG